jgi:pSer/pThr/pTyr-binding forkhead associated (FHA) protein
VIEGSVRELRNIAEVYLRHQSGQGRSSIIVADGLERLSVPVLRELERLAGLRFRNRPIVHMVLLTRNEDLVSDLTPEDGGGQLARYLHQRLTGFDLEETRGYLRACLQSVGCHWEEELIPPEVIIDIQAFTHGIVADIDALCFEALNLLSREDHGAQQRPRLTRALVRQAGGGLHMKYDPRAWQSVDEALSPDSVQESDPGELEIHTARLLVSSGGKVVAEVRLNRPRMVLGRDQGCDISLNSSYVSRYQNLFMETPDGWVIIDLNSTNGCFVNGRRVQEHKLRDGDTIAVGHHQLSFVRGRGGAERGQNVELISVGHADSAPADADTRVGRGIR